MPVRFILSDGFRKSEDWLGNNAAFTCPVNGCGQVYLVSAHLNRHGRECPVCHRSKAFAYSSLKKGGWARIVW